MSLRHVGGCIPSRPDKRDWLLSQAFRLGLPPVLYTGARFRLEERTPISNQQGTNSCVAHAVCDACELVMRSPVVQLSRRCLYWSTRQLGGFGAADRGCRIADAFTVLRVNGVSLEAECPWNPSAMYEPPTIRELAGGMDQRIDSYYRIDGQGRARLALIEQAMRCGFPVVFGSEVDLEWTQATDDERAYEEPRVVVGRHAHVFVGLESDGFIVRGSWGRDYGRDGYSKMSFAWAASDSVFDCWAITGFGLALT